MDDQGVQSVSQALRYSASVLGETRLSMGRYDSVFIRGFGGSGGSAGFVNMLDGLRLQRGVNFLVPAVDPWGLERVEVIRGPASVIFGQVKPGGLIEMVSKRPRDVAHGEIQVQLGSFERRQLAFDIGGPVTPDKTILYRVVGLGRAADTQVDFTKEERLYIAPSVTFQPNAATSLTLLTSFQRDPETGFYGFIPSVGTALPNRNGKIRSNLFPGEPNYEGYSRNHLTLGYALEHRFNDVFSFRQNVPLQRSRIAQPHRRGRFPGGRPAHSDAPRHCLEREGQDLRHRQPAPGRFPHGRAHPQGAVRRRRLLERRHRLHGSRRHGADARRLHPVYGRLPSRFRRFRGRARSRSNTASTSRIRSSSTGSRWWSAAASTGRWRARAT